MSSVGPYNNEAATMLDVATAQKVIDAVGYHRHTPARVDSVASTESELRIEVELSFSTDHPMWAAFPWS